MGRERTNFTRENVETEQLRWEGKGGNVTFPFVIPGETSVVDSWKEGQRPIEVGRETPALGRELACLFPGIAVGGLN